MLKLKHIIFVALVSCLGALDFSLSATPRQLCRDDVAALLNAEQSNRYDEVHSLLVREGADPQSVANDLSKLLVSFYGDTNPYLGVSPGYFLKFYILAPKDSINGRLDVLTDLNSGPSMRDIFGSVPLWSKDFSTAATIAMLTKAFRNSNASFQAANWLDQLTPFLEADPEFAALATNRTAAGSIRAAAILPFDNLPDPIRSHFSLWTRHDPHSDIQGLDIKTCRRSPSPVMCESTYQYHFEALENSLKDNYDTEDFHVVVYTKGIAVGAIKNLGTSTFLAFRNIRDSEGRFLLVAGGLYDLTFEVKYRATIASRKGAESSIDLNSFTARPLMYAADGYHSVMAQRRLLDLIDRFNRREE